MLIVQQEDLDQWNRRPCLSVGRATRSPSSSISVLARRSCPNLMSMLEIGFPPSSSMISSSETPAFTRLVRSERDKFEVTICDSGHFLGSKILFTCQPFVRECGRNFMESKRSAGLPNCKQFDLTGDNVCQVTSLGLSSSRQSSRMFQPQRSIGWRPLELSTTPSNSLNVNRVSPRDKARQDRSPG